MADYQRGRDADTLRSDIAEAYEAYMLELGQAGPHWERKPAGGAEGEDAWCARQVAEHLAGASGYFANMIGKQVGMEAAPMQRFAFADCGAACDDMPGAHMGLMAIVGHVRDEHLGHEFEFAPLGMMTVGNVVGVIDHHLRDHAAQLRTLRETP